MGKRIAAGLSVVYEILFSNNRFQLKDCMINKLGYCHFCKWQFASLYLQRAIKIHLSNVTKSFLLKICYDGKKYKVNRLQIPLALCFQEKFIQVTWLPVEQSTIKNA